MSWLLMPPATVAVRRVEPSAPTVITPPRTLIPRNEVALSRRWSVRRTMQRRSQNGAFAHRAARNAHPWIENAQTSLAASARCGRSLMADSLHRLRTAWARRRRPAETRSRDEQRLEGPAAPGDFSVRVAARTWRVDVSLRVEGRTRCRGSAESQATASFTSRATRVHRVPADCPLSALA
jgi:hypothetical protein